MKFVTVILITSALVLIASIILQEYMPAQIIALTKYSAFKDLSQILHKVFKFPINIFFKNSRRSKPPKKANKERIFTKEELKKYNAEQKGKMLYLAILGQVYDVTKGKKYYGLGGGYSFFTGRDGSRAFITGDFTEEGLNDDISNLSSQDYLGLEEWLQFYNKEYTYVGKLIGRFYDENGELTPYNLETLQWISEARSLKNQEDKEKIVFPPCNSEWSPESGTRLYCTKRSGGVERDWVGVPRQLFHQGVKKERCACVKNFGPPSHDPTRNPHPNRGDLDNPSLMEYVGCLPDQSSCQIVS